MKNKTKIEILLDKGVKIPLPGSVLIGDEVDTARITGDNVTIYPGTKIFGEKTLVMSGVKLGFEGPVTIENSLIGPGTSLKGGFFQDAVFAGNNSFGSGAHVRGGTILEEGASAAHTVGLKQTLLFPFVTLGSLINFCDCLMAGGTSRKDHSEVGSSFIHFNYTPNQDKATPSMFGNVYQGVMLNNSPVFLGGQGGVVGPCRLAFGSVTAAGTICRKDESRADRLILGGAFKDCSIAKKKSIYTVVKRVYLNNCRYIAGLIALMNWYRYIRPFFLTDSLSEKLHIGMKNNLENLIDERINRLGGFCSNLVKSREIILSQSRGKKTDLIL
ncbi:MAG: protein GlmU, partial [Thermodesulfobacteriota bacterium]|nr:protein GlmU [Thermodesulfobacteriota bacterium]